MLEAGVDVVAAAFLAAVGDQFGAGAVVADSVEPPWGDATATIRTTKSSAFDQGKWLLLLRAIALLRCVSLREREREREVQVPLCDG